MEAAIAKVESRITEIEANFADPDFYKAHAGELAELERELNTLRGENDSLYARWEELESIKAGAEA